MSVDISSLPHRLGPRSAGITMTVEEFDALPHSAFDRRFRYELIRGVLVVSPFAKNSELGPNEYLGYLLLRYQEGFPEGSALDATLFEQTVYLTENRRRCDRALWISLGRMPDPRLDMPTIIVEFVSRSRRDHRRDYEEKLREYVAAGVCEYWVINRFSRMMTVYRNAPAGLETIEVREAESYQTDLLPGFLLPLAKLMQRADLWPEKSRGPRRRGTD